MKKAQRKNLYSILLEFNKHNNISYLHNDKDKIISEFNMKKATLELITIAFCMYE